MMMRRLRLTNDSGLIFGACYDVYPSFHVLGVSERIRIMEQIKMLFIAEFSKGYNGGAVRRLRR